MPKLTANVALSHEGQVVTLAEGSDLPEWAAGLVGPHVLDGEAEAKPTEDEANAADETTGEQADGEAEAKPTTKRRR